MKKFLAFAVIAAFLITPSISSAQKTVLADSDLGAISAQTGSATLYYTGSATVVFTGTVIIPGGNLSSTSTNCTDFWGQKYASDAYFGMADVNVNAALVAHSGSITESVSDTDDPSIPSRVKMNVTINDLVIASPDMGLSMTLKLGTKSDLTTWNGTTQLPDQVLGLSYTGGISATINGGLTIYAHN